MAYALVGTAGVLGGTGVSSTFTPAWGTGESRTAGNLLILWLGNSGAVAGWTDAVSTSGARIAWKIAAGADAAPSVTCSYAQLAEFSGNAASSPLDQTGGVTMTSAATSPQVISTGSGGVPPDVAAGELMLYGWFLTYTTAATKTTTNTLNNGATAHDTSNDATSIVTHVNFGWGITTGNSVVDQASLAFTVTKFSSGGGSIASMLLPAAVRLPDVNMAPPIAP